MNDGSESEDETTHVAKKDCWVVLNVGGKRYETFMSTLTKYPDTMLAKVRLLFFLDIIGSLARDPYESTRA